MFTKKHLALFIIIMTNLHVVNAYEFITGNQYQKLSNYEKQIYIIGVLDGSTSMLWGVGELETREWLIKCTNEKPITQLVAIFDQYLKNNPKNWHNTASSSFHWAIRGVCPMKDDK